MLLVEDDPADARLLREGLAERGAGRQHLEHVTTLAQAEQQLAARPAPDVVLLDLSLPDSTGLDTLDRLLGLTRVPVVVLTGRTTTSWRGRRWNAGPRTTWSRGRSPANHRAGDPARDRTPPARDGAGRTHQGDGGPGGHQPGPARGRGARRDLPAGGRPPGGCDAVARRVPRRGGRRRGRRHGRSCDGRRRRQAGRRRRGRRARPRPGPCRLRRSRYRVPPARGAATGRRRRRGR